MNTRIPGLDELVQVFTQASNGPFHIQSGTIFDDKDEIVSEFGSPEDTAAIIAFLTIKGELIDLLKALPPMLAHREDQLSPEEADKLAAALLRLKIKIASFEHPENKNVHT